MEQKWKAEFVGSSDAGPDGVDVYEVVTADGWKRICENVSEKDANNIAALPDLVQALAEIESVSTDQHAVGIAKAALAKVEE